MADLRDKKPGDEVWVEGFRNHHHRNTGVRPMTVEKVGREYLYAGRNRFRLSDGYEATAGGYSPCQRAYFDEASYLATKARAERETRFRRLVDSRGISRLSDQLIDAVISELEPAK